MTGKNRVLALLSLLFLACSALPVVGQTKALGRLLNDARKASENGEHQLADSLRQAWVERFRSEGHPRGYDYSEVLNEMARRAIQKGQVDSAITLQTEIIEVRRTAPDCTYAQTASAVSDLATYYSRKGLYTKAIETGEKALEMFQIQFGDNHHFYAIAQANQASYYAARGEDGDYQRAVELAEQATAHMKKGTPEYANALNSLVVFYSLAGRRADANRLSPKARKEARKRMEADGVGYAMVIINNAIRLARSGNYDDAIDYALAAKDCYEMSGNEHTLGYSKVLINLATFYSHQQQFREALPLLERALATIEQISGTKHPDYVRCLGELSEVYRGLGDLEKADELALTSNKLGQQLGRQNTSKYAKSLSKQAATFASNGNYARAIETERKAHAIYEARRDTASMAFSLVAVAGYLAHNGEQERGLATAEEALELFRHGRELTPQYAQALNNTAILYYNSHDYERASVCGRQSLALYEQLGDTANAVYARIKSNNGLYLFMKDSLEEAIDFTRQAIDLHVRVLGADHPDNVPLLYNLSVYLLKAGRIHDAEDSYRKAMAIQAQQVRTNFLHLTSAEREKFWNQKSYVFRFAPMLAYLDRDSGDMAAEAYDSQLFTKGILLNSDIDFKRLLKRSGDTALLQKYNKLEELRHEEEEFYKMPATERNATILAQKKEEIFQLERALVKGCREYGSFTESLSIHAGQVAAALAPDEVAIEFADIYLEGMGTTYLALVLRSGQPRPDVVRLFADADLRDLTYADGKDFFQALKTRDGIDEVYGDPRFGALLWQPIMARLQGVKKVFFSPTALFYQMGIEYLPCDSVHRIGQLYDVCRLSSTKSLVSRQKKGSIETAVVYGGLDYDMDLAQLRQQHDSVAHQHDDYLLALNNADIAQTADRQRTLDSLSVRGAVGYLQGTAHEVESIAGQLEQNDVKTRVFMYDEGTEETFKALSGQSQSIIHIATHGFYFSEQELRQQGRQLVFLSDENGHLDDALNYSGLLFAGANYALQGNRLPDGIEDGVLTAREIAQVDLGHVDLVVLSACQTGLGEIRDDGVFGIQRGFKKAGARSLLMSLWKVDDEATDLMMTRFYERLMDGRELHRAFAEAQQAVREGGYPEPYFWASFILLDGQQ